MMDLITLDMIARSDAVGLERAIKSARPYVDRVIVGVDTRSDDETWEVAQRLGDETWRFFAEDIGLSPEAWAADKIDFAAARNLGRSRVKTPWTLVIDSDEFLECSGDLRALVRDLPDSVGASAIPVRVDDVTHVDPQRLARTEYRWRSSTHNQLGISGDLVSYEKALVVQQLDLRPVAEIERRDKQRDQAIVDLRKGADAGDLSALYHVAKHLAYSHDPVAIEMVMKFRLLTEVHGLAADDRVRLAFALACGFIKQGDLKQAETWAVRMLLDGPRIEAFCLLGDVADLQGRREYARVWYEIACETAPSVQFNVPEALERRFKRREELRR